MGTKNRNRRIADFFLLYHYPFRVLFSTYYTKLSFVVVKKYDNTNNKDNISISKKCCPRLSKVVVKKSHDNIDNKDNISISKSVVQGCPSLSSKKHDNIDNKDNISFLFQKVLSKVVPRCRQKNHLFMKIFIFVSENIKMFCLGNISLSLKSTIRFFLIRISPIQCVRERDGGLRGGSINDGLFHLLMLGNVWVKSLTNLVQCVTEQKMY